MEDQQDDLQTDQTADPEQALAVLRQVVGDEELELDDLKAYTKDRKGWIRKYNDRNERVALKEKELDDKIEKISRLQNQQAQRPVERSSEPSAEQIEQAFYKNLGIDISDSSAVVEITPQQLFRVWNDMRNQLTGSRQQLVQLLSQYGLLEQDEDGRFKPPINVRSKIEQIEGMAASTQTEWHSFLTESFLDGVQDKYPDADRRDLLKIIKESDSDDVEAQVWDAAKAAQRQFDDKVSKRTAKEVSRRQTGRSTATMAGKGASVAGKKAPNPLTTRAGRKALFDRARQATDSTEAV